jgi:Cu-Zn family superoxide dismutase
MTAHGALRSTVPVLFLTALAGCGGSPAEQAATPEPQAPASGLTATATLVATSGSAVSGTVTFTQQDEGVLVFAMISGLAPGPHGFHIHENGDCSAPDGSSAGAHFNPTGMQHGGPDGGERHAGDMGNIVADQGGGANYEQIVTGITLAAGINSIVGRSVVVHADPDDMASQPAGNAGARLACGVIEAATH